MAKPVDLSVLENTRMALKLAKGYHNYKAIGVENVPEDGSAIVLFNHSLMTYDAYLLGLAIYESTGRLMRGLGDKYLFALPPVANLLEQMGIVKGSSHAAMKLLNDGELIGLSPGGMEERLRSSSEKYQIQWDKNKGYARLAIKSQTPVVLASCPRADEIFRIYQSKIAEGFFKRFRLPLPLFRGWGPTLIPRPVQLTHHISAPLIPPDCSGLSFSETEKEVEAFHQKVTGQMNALTQLALQSP